jgi:hypothetical protein
VEPTTKATPARLAPRKLKATIAMRRSRTCWEATIPCSANEERQPSGSPSLVPLEPPPLDPVKNRKGGSLKLAVNNTR